MSKLKINVKMLLMSFRMRSIILSEAKPKEWNQKSIPRDVYLPGKVTDAFVMCTAVVRHLEDLCALSLLGKFLQGTPE